MKRKIKELVGRLFWLGFCQSGGAAELHYLKNVVELQLERRIELHVKNLFESERGRIVSELERKEKLSKELQERGTEILNKVVWEMTKEREGEMKIK